MEPPALHRSALVRVLFAALLACLLAIQALFGAATPALAEANQSATTVTLKRITANELKTGEENKYLVTVTCSQVTTQVCVNNGTVTIEGIPEGWRWSITADEDLVEVSKEVPQVTLSDIGAAGASVGFYLYVTPPNETTPNGKTWNLQAILNYGDEGNSLESKPVETKAVAASEFHLYKEPVTPSSYPGGTAIWSIEAKTWGVDNKEYSQTGQHYPTKIEFTDTLPDGFTPVSIRALPGGQEVKYEIDENGKLTWTTKLGRYSGSSHEFAIYAEVDKDIDHGSYTNRVDAVATYLDKDGKEQHKSDDATAVVKVATMPKGGGEVSKYPHGLKMYDYKRAGIVRRDYSEADTSKRWNVSLTDRRHYDGGINGGWLGFVTGSYALSVSPTQDGVALGAHSDLYPLRQSYADNVPCQDGGASDGDFTYTPKNQNFSSKEKDDLCQDPAFHVTVVEVTTRHDDIPIEIPDGWAPMAILDDGSEVPLERIPDGGGEANSARRPKQGSRLRRFCGA